ncbi:MAG: prepilin-type N-terminal cleavage/methylation domain-containing protein [Myxococcaceae bacterium]|nr:MAG: prepilin-type N-terminal cleavage/methylation domain-containing protein [Myxococcaceae bacterium]
MMNRLFRKKGGFTLIELMIVVAIIGILAAIAIPNFIRFQAKSKQSEAKTNLKAIFTAQKAYFAGQVHHASGRHGGPDRGRRAAGRDGLPELLLQRGGHRQRRQRRRG